MDNEPSATEVLIRMATHALVAGASLPLGVPGAAFGAATVVLFDAAAEADRRVWRRLDQMVNDSTAEAGLSPEQLQTWATADDGRLALVRDLVAVALTTLDEQKIRALGSVLTAAIRDDAVLDSGPLIVSTVRDLDPIHVMVLRSMLSDDNPQDPSVVGMREGETSILSAHRWTWSALHEHLPQVGGGLLSNVLATLQRHGLIDKDPRYGDTYTPTSYVLDLFQHLRPE